VEEAMNIDKISSIMQEIEKDKFISKDIVISALKEALVKAYRKEIEIADAMVKVEIDEQTGEVRMFSQKLVVEEEEDDYLEISLENARNFNPDYNLGDYFDTEIDVNKLGRAAAILAKSVLKQKIREAEKQAVHDEYIDKLYEMVTGTVDSIEEKFVVINLGRTLAILPKSAQIPGERYYKNDRIKVVITDVNKDSKGAQVLVSRADPNLVRRLFENEVPEIYDGIVEIKAIARDPGERCKMSVYSKRKNVDAIGACIGPKGQRVRIISEEILGEKIDIFEWSDNIYDLVKNAFSPADVKGIFESKDRKGICVVVDDNQLSLAIGKKGKNARLAVKLTGCRIDIKTISDVEKSEIDWKIETQAYMAKVTAELRKKQAAEEAALQATKVVDPVVIIEEPVIEIEEVVESEMIIDETPVVEPVIIEEKPIVKEPKRAKKELKPKSGFVSKLEALADPKAPKKPEEKVKPKFVKKDPEEAERKLRPSELKKDKGYAIAPIYSEEELEEISLKAEDNRWEEEDINYDDYDKFYDEN
jgi:transcription termination/antitermination protein NusA